MENNLESVVGDLKNIKGELKTKSEEVEEAKKAVNERQTLVDEKQKVVDALRKVLAEERESWKALKEKMNADLTREKGAAEKRSNELQEERKKLQDTSTKLKIADSKTEALDRRINKLLAEKTHMEEGKRAAEKSVQDLNVIIIQLRCNIEQATSNGEQQCQSMRTEVQNLTAQVRQLQGEVDTKQTLNERLTDNLRDTIDMFTGQVSSLEDRLTYNRTLRDHLIKLQSDIPIPSDYFQLVVPQLRELEFDNVDLKEAQLQSSILKYFSSGSPVDIKHMASRLQSHPEYLPVIQEISAQMFTTPEMAINVIQAAKSNPNDLELWLPTQAWDHLWNWPPYYVQWIEFWMSSPLPPPETIQNAIANGIDSDQLILKFSIDAAGTGDVKMAGTLTVDGEKCSAFRAKDDLIWRKGDIFYIIPVRDIVVQKWDLASVRIGERNFVLTEELQYYLD